MRRQRGNWNLVRALALALAAGCGDPDLKAGINAGPAGAGVGQMAAREVRMAGAAKDRRFDVRIAAQTIIARGELTPEILGASLDSLAADEDVAVIVSRFLEKAELDAARRFNAAGQPYLSLSPLPRGIATANGPGFSLVPSLRAQAEFLAQHAQANDRITVVHLNNEYGRELAALLVAALRARGFTQVDVRHYEQSWDEPRVVALGTEIEAASPTVMFFLGRAPSLELVWQPFRNAAKPIRVFGSDLVESPALYANREGRFTGLKYVRYFDPKSRDPRMDDLNTRYWMWLSLGEMTNEAALVYDAMLLMGDALRAGARTDGEFISFFASLGKSRPAFDGVGGPIAFDENGDVQREFKLAEVTGRGVLSADSAAALRTLADTTRRDTTRRSDTVQ